MRAASQTVFFVGTAVACLLSGCGTPPDAAPAAAIPVETSTESPGFVVWESNRSGAWRLWRSDLEGDGLSQLTGDRRGERHCCAHISPDGSRLAYLSLPTGRQRYLDRDAVGELRLLTLENGEVRPLATARTYFEHRAVVWRDAGELNYIAEDGSVRRLDVDSGQESTVLAAQGRLDRRWLVNGDGAWAATGRGALAPVETGDLGAEIPLAGCQPYFSLDGRWGLWTAGAGGPIDRFELATGEASTILGKGDARLPADRGYAYFPMLSSDGTLLAFAASGGEHDHFKADYDLFLAEVDPLTLELQGDPWPIAAHPSVDRFPDVWRETLELGRVVGEIPVSIGLASAEGEPQVWTLDGATSEGERLDGVVERPGIYPVTALGAAGLEHGVVVALAPAGKPAWSEGWPVLANGALWSWSADSGLSTTPLSGHSHGPIRPPMGRVDVDGADELLHKGLRRTNQLAIELLLTTPHEPASNATILAVGRDLARQSFSVLQRDGRLVLRMRIGSRGAGAYGETDLGPVPASRRIHLAISYTPGRTNVYRNGRLAMRKRDLIGHFFHWQPYPLSLAAGGWEGELEAVALYDRLFSLQEARRAAEHFGLRRLN